MSEIIVCTGRGGTGKTTFTALAARLLNRHPLLIDADPDQSLPEALGIDLAEEGVQSVSDVLYEIQRRTLDEDFGSMSLPDKIKFLCNQSCLYESPALDLLTLGVKWTQGCYCMPNNILRTVIPEMAASYTYTLIDAPAGLEHINRRVVSNIDHIFAIADPSQKALKNVERLRRVASQVGITFGRLYLVGNYRVTDELEAWLQGSGEEYVGRIAEDNDVAEYHLQGKTLALLPTDSVALQSVRSILEKTGFSVEDEEPLKPKEA